MRDADLAYDNLGGTTDLEGGADLRNAKLAGADFTRARLAGADLRGARAAGSTPERPTRFDGADLNDASLGGADLTGASYDAETRFPRGFRPASAGMVQRAGRKKAEEDEGGAWQASAVLTIEAIVAHRPRPAPSALRAENEGIHKGRALFLVRRPVWPNLRPEYFLI